MSRNVAPLNGRSAGLGEKENSPPNGQAGALNGPGSHSGLGAKRPRSDDSDILTRGGPVRKQLRTDPLVSFGRHFGRTVRTFCRIQPLIKNGMARAMQLELGRLQQSDLSPSELKEQEIYSALLGLSPDLEERLFTGSDQEIFYVADMITKGISAARSDDVKTLKSVVVDWIKPDNGILSPPIQRNVKTDRGFHHPRTGELLCPVNLDWNDPKIRRELSSGQLVPSGDLWPRFLYRNHQFDPLNPWDGLLRGILLVYAFKHVFTSPSSVNENGVSRATRSGNARIHGMKSVTIPSLAYIATLVRFSLNSSPTFSRTDTVTDSEYFYNLFTSVTWLI